jgi:2-desacetyl-2-hydroxyethyl bacteriochlorophyllide A dehydrogenase
MKALLLEKPLNFKQIEIDEPAAPGPGQALVRVHRIGICGTDISGYLGKMPFFKYPRIPGHELGVEVVSVGDDVTQIQPGDRCSVEPYMNCGQCIACRRGNTNCCEKLDVIGVMIDGGMCERFLIPADKLHRSDKLEWEQLALVETLAIGCHAVDRGAPEAGENVLVIGAGPIGLSVIEFARLAQANLTVLDMNQQRLDFCKDTMGVDHTVQFKADGSELDAFKKITNGDLFTLVVDATGSNKSMSHALNYVGHTGKLVYVGITTQEISFVHPLLHRREMTLLASRNAHPRDFGRIIDLIETGHIDTNPWITHHCDFDKLPETFESYTKPETGVIKAIVHMD